MKAPPAAKLPVDYTNLGIWQETLESSKFILSNNKFCVHIFGYIISFKPFYLPEMTQEEFDIKMKEHLAKLMTPKKATIRRPGPVQKTAEVKCKVCGKSLGYMSQVRKFGQSHFLIMDGTLHEKVKPYPDPIVMKPMDGMLFQ